MQSEYSLELEKLKFKDKIIHTYRIWFGHKTELKYKVVKNDKSREYNW